jgi:pilus assembly protein CpaB
MREGKALIVLGSGILIALSTGLFTYGWLNGKIRAHATETQPVAVAATDLKWGTVVSKEMVKSVPFLKQTLPAGCFPDVAGIEGRALVYPVKAGEPILESRLSPPDVKSGGIAAVVGARKRAMAVKVDNLPGIVGFLRPGDRVDVIATLNRTTGAPVTRTVAENVLVLATGPGTERVSKNEKPEPGDTITLEVGPGEAEKLAFATAEGTLQLALRNLADSGPAATRGATIRTLLSSSGGTGARKAVKETGGVGRSTVSLGQDVELVELIKGTTVTVLRFYTGE